MALFSAPCFFAVFGIRTKLTTPKIANHINGKDNSKFIESFEPNLITGKYEKNTTIGSKNNIKFSNLFSDFFIYKLL